MKSIEHMIKFTLAFCAALYCLTSCNPHSGRGGVDPDFAGVVKVNFGVPLEQALSDSACQTSTAEFSVGGYSYSVLKNGAVTTDNTTKLLTSNKEKGMHSELIDSTLINQKDVTQFSMSAKYGFKKLSVTEESNYNTEYLRLCSPPTEVSRGTVEATSLTSIALLEKAYDYYQSLGVATKLSTLNLIMLPDIAIYLKIKLADDAIETLKKDDAISNPNKLNNKDIELHLTDNAAWGLDDKDPKNLVPQFYIFPQGDLALRKSWFGKTPLWEMPFVLSHEFGHHVFYSLLPQIVKNFMRGKARTPFSQIFISTQIPLVDKLLNSRTSLSDSSTGEFVSAFNEGFADLYGYYATAGNDQLSTLKCMQKSREVSSDTFINGDKKILTDSVWNEFTKDVEEASVGDEEIPDPEKIDCEDFDYKDPHILGAIIANAINALFNETSLKNDTSFKSHGKALLEWVISINTEIEKDKYTYSSNQPKIFELAIRQAFNTALQYSSSGEELLLCNVLKERLPAYFTNFTSSQYESGIGQCF